jgi:hypothetical protein
METIECAGVYPFAMIMLVRAAIAVVQQFQGGHVEACSSHQGHGLKIA